ncbi:MAG: DUF86 domain-containing protein [Coprothermobacterota bacterium]|nr:DUF86 domain-containing protein [Coprothermobacterota bacterium]
MKRDDTVYLQHVLDAIAKAQSYLLDRDDIAGMRDKLIHDYFGVDLDTVWLTAIEDLPVLQEEVSAILRQLSE